MMKMIMHKFLKHILAIIALTGCFNSLFAQQKINVNNIEIIRDNYGIPHIFTKTDAEAVYGIAWAQCEDNFEMMLEKGLPWILFIRFSKLMIL